MMYTINTMLNCKENQGINLEIRCGNFFAIKNYVEFFIKNVALI